MKSIEVCYPSGNDLSREMLPIGAFTQKVTNPILSDMKLIPKPSENYAELNKAFVSLVDAEKLKGNGQAVIAEAIGVLPNYVSNIYNDRKGLGDEVIAKIDEKYPGWRNLAEEENEPNAEKVSSKKKELIISGVKIDSEEEQLLYMFSKLTSAHRYAVMSLANTLSAIDAPKDRKIKPFVGEERRKTDGRTDLGPSDLTIGDEDAGRNQNSRVQKQGAR